MNQRIAFRRAALVAASLIVLGLPARISGEAADRKQAFVERREDVKLPNRSIELRCAKPVTPRSPAFLVVFASGDGGLRGDSQAVYKYMAERGHYVAAFSSREALAQHKGGDLMTLEEGITDITAMMKEAKRLMDLPEATPTVVAGVSRGANMVVFTAAAPTLRASLAGAMAIALTRETDYVKAPPPGERPAYITLDDKQRILTYPLLDQLGSIPIAVIQSTNDSYVPSKESRQLMGPDTATRRLFEVQARNHSFSGGMDELLRDVGLALDWIAAGIRDSEP